MFERWLELYKIRLVLGVIVLFLVSTVMSCQELHYAISGKTVDARVVKDMVEQRPTRYGDVHERRVIRYSFMDNQNSREEYAEVPMDWPASGQDLPSARPGSLIE